jgi:ribosome-binding ATPase YchF (GTP1/OBG family)
VIGYDDFLACGYSEKDAKAKGLHRLEGKQYVVKDADVMNILASH